MMVRAVMRPWTGTRPPRRRPARCLIWRRRRAFQKEAAAALDHPPPANAPNDTVNVLFSLVLSGQDAVVRTCSQT